MVVRQRVGGVVAMGTLPSSQPGLPQEGREECERDVRKQVRGLLGDMLYPRGNLLVERRRLIRYPFPQPVCLTLLSEDQTAPKGELIVAAGKDISEFGIGFFHAAPLPSQQMVVSLQVAKGRWLAFVIEVIWSRTIRQGWCESGARFIRPVAVPPLESA
jgi:hypothetical protein